MLQLPPPHLIDCLCVCVSACLPSSPGDGGQEDIGRFKVHLANPKLLPCLFVACSTPYSVWVLFPPMSEDPLWYQRQVVESLKGVSGIIAAS